MKYLRILNKQAKRLGVCICLLVLVCSWCAQVLIHADTSATAGPQWANPAAMALRRASSINPSQHEPVTFNNLDCVALTYRLTSSAENRVGCFTQTAIGMLDSDDSTLIFTGTDEGLRISPYSAGEVIAPWPSAEALIAIDPLSTGGAYISLYRSPLSAMQNTRNFVGQLTGKVLTQAADLPLTDVDGQRIIINPQTLTVSDGGSWLVAETMAGSYVRINLATLDTLTFGHSLAASGDPALLHSRIAVSDDGRYVAVQSDQADVFRVYNLQSCGGESCGFYDYQPFVKTQLIDVRSIRHVRFVNESLLSFEVTASKDADSGVYELAPSSEITSLIDYLGLGDSYTSGEGAFDYENGTDMPDNMCHLSARSYPLLLTSDFFSAASGHSVACSGAVINDVGSTNNAYIGQVRGVANYGDLSAKQPLLLAAIQANFVPGYIAQQRFVKQYQPQIVTVSVGGDDIGFGAMVQDCVEPHISRHESDSTCFNTYEDRQEVINLINRTQKRWVALYKQLSNEDPAGHIYAIGYPQILKDTGNCALNVHLNRSELEFAEELIEYLNASIKQAASVAGVRYVDIGQALAGHRLCEAASATVAMNGLTAGTDAGVAGIGVFGKESYHPNALGQALIEEEIIRQTNHFKDDAATSSTGTSTPDASSLLNQRVSGRVITDRIPATNFTPYWLEKGRVTAVNFAGGANGLSPNSTYTVRLDGSTGNAIGTITSDVSGTISGQIAIPSDASAGGHTVDITGGNQSGGAVDVTQPIFIHDGSSDDDGDGIPNDLDSCPGAINSGHDADHDSIDDACDPLISAPGPGNTDIQNPPSGTNSTATPTNSSNTQSSNDSGSSSSSSEQQTVPPTEVNSSAFEGMPLAPSESVIARFRAGNASISNIKSSATKAFSHAIGASTINPQLVSRGTHYIVKKQRHTLPLPRDKLEIIAWLRWVILLVIAWFILLIALALAGKMNNYGEERLYI